ncbi:MAG: hypothetical protein ABI140_07935 [Jatrophihabitantaceae bacterium]
MPFTGSAMVLLSWLAIGLLVTGLLLSGAGRRQPALVQRLVS